jgi:hypothetical protein
VVDEVVAYCGETGRRSVDRFAMAEAAANFRNRISRCHWGFVNVDGRLEFHTALGTLLMIVRGCVSGNGHVYRENAAKLQCLLLAPIELHECLPLAMYCLAICPKSRCNGPVEAGPPSPTPVSQNQHPPEQ